MSNTHRRLQGARALTIDYGDGGLASEPASVGAPLMGWTKGYPPCFIYPPCYLISRSFSF